MTHFSNQSEFRKKSNHRYSKIGIWQEGCLKIFPEQGVHCLWQGVSEDKNFDAEPT